MSLYPQQDAREAYEEAEGAMSNPMQTLTKRRLRAMLALCEDVETEELEKMEQCGLKLRDLNERGYFRMTSRQKRRRQTA